MSVDLNQAAALLTDEQIKEFQSHIDKSGGPNADWPWMGEERDGMPIWRTTVDNQAVTFSAPWLSLWLHQNGK